jgi:hypothetical protein
MPFQKREPHGEWQVFASSSSNPAKKRASFAMSTMSASVQAGGSAAGARINGPRSRAKFNHVD